jgi:NDP-sugar pyrophosphorylase family protein
LQIAVKTDTEERFVVCYADNLSDFEVGKLVSFLCEREATASLALFVWNRGVST